MRAFTAGHDDTGYTRGVVDFPIEQLGDGDVVVRVHYSGINFKDGLAGSEKGKVARLDPIIPGIDLAGEVVESSDRVFEEAAVRAVAKWRFEPGRRDGRVVRFRMAVPIVFALNAD